MYRPSTGDWFVRNQFAVNFGGPGHVPIVGDYNGDGTDDVAVFQTSTGSGSCGTSWPCSSVTRATGRCRATTTATARRIIAVYRPSTGQWFVRNQFTVQFGDPGDIAGAPRLRR